MIPATTRKRRAYCQEDDDSAEPIRPRPSQTPLPITGLENASFTPHQPYIDSIASNPVTLTAPNSRLLDLDNPASRSLLLEETAKFLNVPVSDLLALQRPRYQQQPKRPRFNSAISMTQAPSSSPGTQNMLPESPIPKVADSGSSGEQYAGFVDEAPVSGWVGSSLAEYLSNFAICPPCSVYESPTSYQHVSPTGVPYPPYRDTGPPMTQTSGPMQRRPQASYPPAQVNTDPTGLLACDDPSMVAYLPNYTPLQPSRAQGNQPSTKSEEMLYPDAQPRGSYLTNSGFSDISGLGIQGSSTNKNGVIAEAMQDELTSPSLASQTAYGGIPPGYELPHGYAHADSVLAVGSHGLSLQEMQSYGGVYNPHHRTPSARRGPFKDHEKREKTAHTRKIGSCIRCRMQRIRCNVDPEDDQAPCLTCKRVATNRVWRLSCLRWKITDVQLFKPGQVKGLEWTKRWKDSVLDDIGSWAGSETKAIRVTEGYTGQFIELRVRQFRPQEGDKLDRSWMSRSGKKSVPIPPWAIVDMEAAKSAFDDYIKKGLIDCCKRLLGPHKKLLWRTYALGMRLTEAPSTDGKERELLNNTLYLWMSVRLTTKSFEIVGEETLGMPRNIIDDRDTPLHGKIPLPPVMGAQIDSVLIHQIQANLRRKTLEDLQKMTQEKKQRTWLTTYIVTFILLHNISLITKHDADYARKHGLETRWAREDKVKEYNMGANTLLAYFHYCNKGIYPFSEECRDQDLQTLASLDEVAIEFVKDTRGYVAEHKRHWEELWERKDYENEYYYVSQLFETNWQPRIMV